jgi:hypothetical protein
VFVANMTLMHAAYILVAHDIFLVRTVPGDCLEGATLYQM